VVIEICIKYPGGRPLINVTDISRPNSRGTPDPRDPWDIKRRAEKFTSYRFPHQNKTVLALASGHGRCMADILYTIHPNGHLHPFGNDRYIYSR
jgi:hypothetical protein